MRLINSDKEFNIAIAEWIEGYIDTLKDSGISRDLMAYNINYGLNEMFKILLRRNLVRQILHVRMQEEDNMLHWDVSILDYDRKRNSSGSIMI